MKLSGAEILIKTLSDYNVDTIFGYPGSCVMYLLDYLYDNKDIKTILVRHEQGAVHAACAYAQLSDKPGVVMVTSGPGATNTITGIADALSSNIPLIVITGQVTSTILGTDAFQEIDVISLTTSVTKWNCQVRKADQMVDAVSRAFEIATSDCTGPVVLDITKDAQSGEAEYIPDNIKHYHVNTSINKIGNISTSVYVGHNNGVKSACSKLLETLCSSGEDIILVVDKLLEDICLNTPICSGKIISSDKFKVPGFGLPAAIGAKHAAPDKTICLIAGSLEFQATIKELGVIAQEKISIKIILFRAVSCKSKFHVADPDFVKIASAYGIKGERIYKDSDLEDSIQRMLSFNGSYLLEIDE